MKKLLALFIAITLSILTCNTANAWCYYYTSTPVVYTAPVIYTTPVVYTTYSYPVYYTPRWYRPRYYYTYYW